MPPCYTRHSTLDTMELSPRKHVPHHTLAFSDDLLRSRGVYLKKAKGWRVRSSIRSCCEHS